MTLLLMLPVSAYALSVGVEHDVNVSAGGATIGVSQDGNKITVCNQTHSRTIISISYPLLSFSP